MKGSTLVIFVAVALFAWVIISTTQSSEQQQIRTTAIMAESGPVEILRGTQGLIGFAFISRQGGCYLRVFTPSQEPEGPSFIREGRRVEMELYSLSQVCPSPEEQQRLAGEFGFTFERMAASAEPMFGQEREFFHESSLFGFPKDRYVQEGENSVPALLTILVIAIAGAGYVVSRIREHF